MSRTISRWLPVLAVAGVLGAVWLAATLSAPELTRLPIPRPSPEEQTLPSRTVEPTFEPGDSDGGGRLSVPDWVLTLAASLCLTVVVVLVGALVWFLVRNSVRKRQPRLFVEDETPQPMAERADDEVIAAVDAGLDELSDLDADPRRAVIACWVRLERAAAAAGTPRHIGDSPTDLVSRLLAAHQVSRAALDGLAGVYREARYATRPVDEHARQAALAALRQLRAELGGVPSG